MLQEAALAGGLSESDGDFAEDDGLLGKDAEDVAEGRMNGAGGPAEPRKQIYNTDQLHDKLEDIAWSEQAEWLETQVITADSRPQIDNVEDDLTRELAFFNQVWIQIGHCSCWYHMLTSHCYCNHSCKASTKL